MISQVVKFEAFPFKKLEQGGMFGRFCFKMSPKKSLLLSEFSLVCFI